VISCGAGTPRGTTTTWPRSPYRDAHKIAHPGRQGDDSLLFAPRPIEYRTPGSRAKEAQRRADLPPAGRQVLEDAVPLAVPQADTAERYVREHPDGGKRSGGGFDFRNAKPTCGGGSFDFRNGRPVGAAGSFDFGNARAQR
jgi:hypothetical protein